MTLAVSFVLLVAGVYGVAWVHRHEKRARRRREVVETQRLSGTRWSLVPVSPRGRLHAIDYDPTVGDPRVDLANEVALPIDVRDVN